MAVVLNASTSSGAVLSSDTSGVLQLQNNGTVAVTVTGGNVGIGTSSPSELLHIYGSNPYLLLQGTETSAQTLYIRESAGGLYFGQYTVGTRMLLDSSGNLGLGVTPSAWNSLWTAQQIGQAMSVFAYKSGSNYGGISNNVYSVDGSFTGTGPRRINAGYATAYTQDNSGAHNWYLAGTSTAGSTIAFTQAMTLNNSGSLVFGVSGQGVQFTNSNALTNSILNDYEVGTWTPSPVGLTVVGTPTYTGKYTKIGNQVTCWLNIDSTTSTSATGGTTSIGGLPFSASAVSNSSIGGGTVISSNGVNQVGSGYIYTANNRFYVSGWTATANILITITYQATF